MISKSDPNHPATSKLTKSQTFVMNFLRARLKSELFFLSAIFFILFFGALYFAREIMVPFVIAILISFLLAPAVRFLERIYIPAQVGSALVILFFLLIFSYGLYGFMQPATVWAHKGPEAIKEVDKKLMRLTSFIAIPIETYSNINDEISSFTANIAKENKNFVRAIPAGPSFMGTVFFTTWQFLIETGVMIILLYFLLVHDNFFLRKLVNWLPSIEEKKTVVAIAHEVQNKVWRYLFARIVINIGLAIAVSLAMYLFGMPDPIFWGVMTGILELIPYIGALISIILVALVAVFSFSSLLYAFFTTFTFFVIVLIESSIITPIVIGRALILNPLIIFIAIIFWGWLWGIAGAFIATPMIVIIKIILENFYRESLMDELLAK